MAINTLEFAEKLTGELDRMIVQKAVTGFMADNVMQARFVGARTVLIPDLDMAGLGDYDRDAGFVQGAVEGEQHLLYHDHGPGAKLSDRPGGQR